MDNRSATDVEANSLPPSEGVVDPVSSSQPDPRPLEGHQECCWVCKGINLAHNRHLRTGDYTTFGIEVQDVWLGRHSELV